MPWLPYLPDLGTNLFERQMGMEVHDRQETYDILGIENSM